MTLVSAISHSHFGSRRVHHFASIGHAMSGWIASYLRSDYPARSGRLCASPKLPEAFIGPVVKPGQILHVVSCEVYDGYIKVSLDGKPEVDGGRPPYFVHVNHVLWKKDDTSRWTVINDDDWYNQSWTFAVREMRIRVSEGTIEEDPTTVEAQDFHEVVNDKSSKVTAKHFQDQGYTYVCLEVGWPFSDDRGETVWRNHHITLGYVPWMENANRNNLFDILDSILKEWPELAPHHRPSSLMRFRKFQCKSPSEIGYDSYRMDSIECLHPHRVQELVANGLLDVTSTALPLKRPLREEVMRLHQRDTNRYASAMERASTLGINDGTLTMLRPTSGLGNPGSLELYDLLEYLADALYHCPLCYSCDDRGKLITPRITRPSSWHCTRQGDWKVTTLPPDVAE